MLLLAGCNISSLSFACYCRCLDTIAAIVSFLLLLLLIYCDVDDAPIGIADNTI